METKALVSGHPRDPIHPFSDADMLVRELRNGRMLEANSLLEMRIAPARLTDEIASFVDECWKQGREREQAAAQSAARKRLIGIVVASILVLAIVGALVAVVLGGGDDNGAS